MWLWAKRYLWDKDEKMKESISKKYPEYSKLKPKEILFEFGYWRKANAIHNWFVENVQDGVDNCGNYYVSMEKLKDLLVLVKKVLKDKKKAEELLPTQSGFFFGETAYNEWYFEGLEYTKKMLEELFNNEKLYEGLDFEYSSSW